MLKIFLLAFIVYSVHCWEARSWTGRDWQSNSGKGGWDGGWGGVAGWGGDGGWKGGWGDGWKGDWGGNGGWDDGKDSWAPALYSYGYGVADGKTGDRKEQTEQRHGDAVVGQYSLKEADGTKRTVKYEADKRGFNAKVIREGVAWHPTGRGGWGDAGWKGNGGKW